MTNKANDPNPQKTYLTDPPHPSHPIQAKINKTKQMNSLVPNLNQVAPYVSNPQTPPEGSSSPAQPQFYWQHPHPVLPFPATRTLFHSQINRATSNHHKLLMKKRRRSKLMKNQPNFPKFTWGCDDSPTLMKSLYRGHDF